MKKAMIRFAGISGLVAMLFSVSVAWGEAKMPKKKVSADAAMHMHHMHTMMDHGLGMALQGSNLVMLSEMKMAPSIDEITLAHGKKMIADGKAMINGTLSGEHMKKMHAQGLVNDPLMKYTHDLGREMLNVIADLENMSMDMGTPEGMKMHHMHIALNHALEMALEGADLMMMGQMKMAQGTDRHFVEHGRQMIADARRLWRDVLGSSAMSAMHAAGTTPAGSPAMGATHKLADDEKKVLDLLANMPVMK